MVSILRPLKKSKLILACLFVHGTAGWDLGFWFGSDTPIPLTVTGGVGNGRYKNIFDTKNTG